jgi:FMN phosphatase YigB (HAD superfamily)
MRVVIWDVDDVLNDLMAVWFEEWWRPQHPEIAVRYADIIRNPPHTVLGVSQEEYLESLDGFRRARFEALPPRPDALRWFAENGSRAHHVVLTGVPYAFAHLSASWVVGHFGRWVKTFAFVPSPRPDDPPVREIASKADYLRWLGRGDVFVDDRDDNVDDAVALGLTGVVVPRPWNTSMHRTIDAAFRDVAALL